MNDCDIKITEDDLRIFPPYVTSFLLVSLLMMVSHGFSGSLLFMSYLDVPPLYGVGMTLATIVIFVILNIRLTRGHLNSVLGLQILAACYFLIAAVYPFVDDYPPLPVWWPATALATSGGAILVIRSRRYRIMAEFVAKIWLFYRTTGRSILQEIERQRRDARRRRS